MSTGPEPRAGKAPFDFEQTFRAQYERIARVIAGVVHDSARAEELAVEIFLKFWRNPKAHGENANGWLYRAAVRKALDESAAYAVAHPVDTIPLISKFSGVDPKLVVPAQLGRASDMLDTRLTQPTIDACAKYNAIPKAFPVREMIDPNVFQ